MNVDARPSKKIIIVDDLPINRHLLHRMLQMLGFDALQMSGGHEVVEYCKTEAVDIIFMDINMPEMDGFEATRLIRKMEDQRSSLKQIEIIAVSANVMTGDRERALTHGFNENLSKPLMLNDLKRVLYK